MCILFILRKKNTKWPFLIATNREEFYNRKFLSPGQHWEKYPSVFAGKDKKAGGSWLGVNKYGVCVSILNRSSNIKNQKSLKTRGEIVINALKYKKALEAKNQFSKNFEKRYNFFNLVIADNKSAYWIKYDDYKLKINTIPYGYSIIDNLDLNDESSLRQKINKNFFKKCDDKFCFDIDLRIKLVRNNKLIEEIPIDTYYGTERSSTHIVYAIRFFFKTIFGKLTN